MNEENNDKSHVTIQSELFNATLEMTENGSIIISILNKSNYTFALESLFITFFQYIVDTMSNTMSVQDKDNE